MASGLIRVVTADRDKELREYIGHSLQFDGRFEIVEWAKLRDSLIEGGQCG